MSKEVDRRLAKLLMDAARERTCLAPPTRADDKALKARCLKEGSGIVSPLPGLYSDADSWNALSIDEKTRWLARGLQAQHPRWVFCGPTAALFHGLWISWRHLKQIHVICNQKDGAALGEAIVRHRSIDKSFELLDDVRVTSLLRTALDCLRFLDFVDGLPIADSYLRISGLSSADAQVELGANGRSIRGVRHALATFAWGDARSESGGESIARAIMIELGFSLPELQREVKDPMNPKRNFRVDFVWEDLCGNPVYGELDGWIKYEDERFMGGRSAIRVMGDERKREARLTAGAAKVVRFSVREAQDREYFARLLKAYGVPQGDPPQMRYGTPIRKPRSSTLSDFLGDCTQKLQAAISYKSRRRHIRITNGRLLENPSKESICPVLGS